MLKKSIFCFIMLFTTTAFAEQTLSLIKPDAIRAQNAGKIIAQIEASGLKLKNIKMLTLTEKQVGEFYTMHKEKPFYGELVEFMTSGPIIAQILESDNAVEDYRSLMGGLDPKTATPGSLRANFGTSKGVNAVHGSDSLESAEREIQFFFPKN
jgi:nucleoside-diphosphate kinase